MIKIYKKKAIPKSLELIKINDQYFNKYTVELLDERAAYIIEKIDRSRMVDKFFIESRFDGTKINIDKLSTGCKTALNILFNQDKIFDISECGENALEIIYTLEQGNVYCEYPMIAFDMTAVKAIDADGEHLFTDYEELKEWWKNEN
jgi:hypothetical protein